MTPRNNQGLLAVFKKFFINQSKKFTFKQNKVQVDEYEGMSKVEKVEATFVSRIEYQEKLTLFKYYLAHQFY